MKVVKDKKIDVNIKDGQNKCPKCGATEISLNTDTGNLKCHYCRHEFMLPKISGIEENITKLNSDIISLGARDIELNSDNVKTLKCSSCGAEVIIDTTNEVRGRCHWCRNILSINSQVSNGAIPDVILPFKVSKEEALQKINGFVGRRKFFADRKFKAEFRVENIMGVYFPYMVVDVNASINLSGKGEHLVRKNKIRKNDNYEVRYEADVYNVERKFNISIYQIAIESNKDFINKNSDVKTNNIINSIMPFDLENCVKYNSNYLRGFSSEKRDINVSEFKEIIKKQSHDITYLSANNTLAKYDRGVAWEKDEFEIEGQQYHTAYLPVWLYSYQEKNGGTKLIHYIAVNGRTSEIMGSMPINAFKLFLVSFLIEIIGYLGFAFTDLKYKWIFLLIGFVFYIIVYTSYRNSSAKHDYVAETKYKQYNMKKTDTFIETKSGLENRKIRGMNNHKVENKDLTNCIINDIDAVKEEVVNNDINK